MTHVRHSLRTAVIAACTGLTATGSRVYTARVYATPETELPCLMVNTIDEAAEPQGLALPDILQRVVTVEVVGLARDTATLADTLDAIAEQVETALGAGVTVSGASIALDYEGAEIRFEQLDQPIGTVTLRFRAQLFTLANAPGTLVNG